MIEAAHPRALKDTGRADGGDDLALQQSWPVAREAVADRLRLERHPLEFEIED